MQLKRKESEMDALGVEVVGELRAQLKGERARLERERSNAEVLGLREVYDHGGKGGFTNDVRGVFVKGFPIRR